MSEYRRGYTEGAYNSAVYWRGIVERWFGPEKLAEIDEEIPF